jgi:hypothetical protein
MAAWNNAVVTNTPAGYRAFLVQFPDSDLTATARKLEERMRNRPIDANAAIPAIQPTNASLACPCGTPSVPLPQRVDLPQKVDLPPKADPPPKRRAEPDPPRRRVVDRPRRTRGPPPDEDVVVVRRAPPPDLEPAVPIIGGFLGGAFGGGGFSRGGGKLKP